MGNNSSRGAYPPQYPPKHAYYSERRRQKPRKGGGGGGMRYREEEEYGYRDRHDRDRQRFPTHSSSHYAHYQSYDPRYGYQPIPPPSLPFPNVAIPSPYPVIPPVPPRHYQSPSGPAVIPNASYLSHPHVHMPEPETAAPAPPVFPHQPMPAGPVIPNMPQPSNVAAGMPVIPPPPIIYAPPQPQHQSQQHAAVIPPPGMMEDYTPEDMREGPPLAPGQYGPSTFPHFEPPEPMQFRPNPLPTPPKDLFELSPYVGLLKDLHRPIDPSTLQRTSPQYATAYMISPTGSHASREKKERKGLFRSLSKRLGGHSKRESEHQVPVPVPIMFAAPIMPGVVPGGMPPSVEPPPGMFWPPGTADAPVIPGEPTRSATPQPQPQPQAPPSPAPSHRSRHSPRQHSPRPLPIKIDLHNQFAGLTHLSSHRVHHDKRSYPTAFHLLESLRFGDRRPDLAEHVRTCKSADEVKAFINQHVAETRPEWEQIVVQMMEEVLYNKFIQHPHLRSLLLSTGVAELLYSDPHDNWWGDGPLGRGANELGRTLERVRHRLVSEGFTIEDT